jgi:hypothetical protein
MYLLLLVLYQTHTTTPTILIWDHNATTLLFFSSTILIWDHSASTLLFLSSTILIGDHNAATLLFLSSTILIWDHNAATLLFLSSTILIWDHNTTKLLFLSCLLIDCLLGPGLELKYLHKNLRTPDPENANFSSVNQALCQVCLLKHL